MNEPKPGTVSDATKKWSPLTEGLSGRSAEVASWVMEREARHLNTGDNHSTVGRALRYIFPVIRKTVETMAAADPQLSNDVSIGVVREITIESFGMVHQAANELEPSNELDKFVRDLKDNEMVTDLASRIHASIAAFPA